MTIEMADTQEEMKASICRALQGRADATFILRVEDIASIELDCRNVMRLPQTLPLYCRAVISTGCDSNRIEFRMASWLVRMGINRFEFAEAAPDLVRVTGPVLWVNPNFERV